MDDQELGAASDDALTSIRGTRIGFVFQQFNLIPTLSASENVALAMAPHHASRAERDQRAEELLTRVGLGIVSSTCRRACRVVSNSASPSLGRWPTGPR
jgi:putative ABC transport system ATP-binding protein